MWGCTKPPFEVFVWKIFLENVDFWEIANIEHLFLFLNLVMIADSEWILKVGKCWDWQLLNTHSCMNLASSIYAIVKWIKFLNKFRFSDFSSSKKYSSTLQCFNIHVSYHFVNLTLSASTIKGGGSTGPWMDIYVKKLQGHAGIKYCLKVCNLYSFWTGWY